MARLTKEELQLTIDNLIEGRKQTNTGKKLVDDAKEKLLSTGKTHWKTKTHEVIYTEEPCDPVFNEDALILEMGIEFYNKFLTKPKKRQSFKVIPLKK